MKMIFDSEEQKNGFLDDIGERMRCPGSYSLPQPKIVKCKYDTCKECWENAIEIEVKEDEQETS